MSDFNHEKYPKSRKVRKCIYCWTEIPVGERHFHFIGKWEGDFQNWRMHEDCIDACNRERDADPYHDGSVCEGPHRRGMTCIESYERDVAEEKAEKARAEAGKPSEHGAVLPNEPGR